MPTKKPKHGANKAGDGSKRRARWQCSKVTANPATSQQRVTKRGARVRNVAEPKAPSEKKSWAALAAAAPQAATQFQQQRQGE